MKVLILGASGFIGLDLYKKLQEHHEIEAIATSRRSSSDFYRVDLARQDEVDDILSLLNEPEDTVVYLAYISKPEMCSKNFELAWKINVELSRCAIKKMLAKNLRVIFLSSDLVYGRYNTSCDENSSLSPYGEYGKMKANVESEFIAHKNFKSVRASYVYSPEDSFTRHLREQNKLGSVVQVYAPFVRSFIFKEDLIEGVVSLLRRWDEFPGPILNFGGPEASERTEYVRAIQENFLPQLKFEVKQAPQNFLSLRPDVIKMRSPNLVRLLERQPNTIWQAVSSKGFSEKWRELL
jgi:dTDP-4-dehydrorhamnose reductase